MKQFRFDHGTLRAPKWLPDGTVRVDAVISRAGVFDYLADDGMSIVREYRSPEEVFRIDSMKSFELAPITYKHPPEGLISPENRDHLAQGIVLEGVRRDGMELVASLHITGANAIAALKRGETAVSCGYEQDIISAPGTTVTGERYDACQTNIFGNHVAVAVHAARAGDVARVRMDNAATMIAGNSPASETDNMITLEMHSKVLGELATKTIEHTNEKARADGLTTEITTLKANLAKAEGERDAAKDAAAKAEKARTDAAAGSMEAAKARITLENLAARFLRTDEKPDDVSKKTDTEIKIAVVEKITGKPLARTDEGYVSARFDAAVEAEGEGEEKLRDIRDLENPVRNDGNDVDKARAEFLNRQTNAWKSTAQKGA